MKKNQKLSDALGVISIASIFAGCVEGIDGGPSTWTVICLAVAFAFGLASKRLQPKSE